MSVPEIETQATAPTPKVPINLGGLAPVIMSANQKGGVGKSTNSVNLAAALGKKGYRVLFIDTDGEASATRSMGIDPDSVVGIYEVLAGKRHISETIVNDGVTPGVDVVASRQDVNVIAHEVDDILRVLSEPMAWARENYDVVVVDTPPSAGATQSLAVYAVATHVIFSVKGDTYSYRALFNAYETMLKPIQREANPNIAILGILIGEVPAQSLSWFKDLWLPIAAYGDEHLLFNSRIRRSTFITDAQREERTIFQMAQRGWKKNHGILRDYENLADEVVERLTRFEEFAAGKLMRTDNLPANFEDRLDKYVEQELARQAAKAAEADGGGGTVSDAVSTTDEAGTEVDNHA